MNQEKKVTDEEILKEYQNRFGFLDNIIERYAIPDSKYREDTSHYWGNEIRQFIRDALSLKSSEIAELKEDIAGLNGNRHTLNEVRKIIGVKEFCSVTEKAQDIVSENYSLKVEVERLKEANLAYESFKNFHNPEMDKLREENKALEAHLSVVVEACKKFRGWWLAKFKEGYGESYRNVAQRFVELEEAVTNALSFNPSNLSRYEAKERVIEAAQLVINVTNNKMFWESLPLGQKEYLEKLSKALKALEDNGGSK